MKAIVNNKFGNSNVLKIKEIEKPTPKAGEVLIKVHATSINTVDVIFRSGKKAIFGLVRLSTGIIRPRKQILGFDFAGEIIEIGPEVKDFAIGDRIFGGSKTGANAEYTIAEVKSIAKIPNALSYNEAAAIPMAGLSALQALQQCEINSKTKILIYGASGGIGTYAIQIAKSFDAHITAVTSGKNKQLAHSLGADEFIDYRKENFNNQGTKYDIIFDTVSKVKNWKKSLKENGTFINAGSPSMSIGGFITSQMGNSFRKKKYISFDTKYLKDDLEFLARLAEEGNLRSVIDKIYTFEEMSKAHEYYELGHTAGKVIVTITN